MRSLLKSLFVCALLSLFAVAALAQTETGQITGTVTDPSGAVVSGATVTAKSVTTSQTRSATTNAAGLYNIASLRPGTYDVTIDKPGFAKVTRRVQLAVGGHTDVSTQMALAGAATTVEVTADVGAATVNTETQTLSSVVTGNELYTLPTSPTRNPYALVGTSGNVAEDNSSNRGAGYAINGQRSASTNILLDGGENVDLFTASVGQTVPLDSVQEFSVLTNNFTAEYGRASGGVVNVVTKSGTNTFHGSAYEFNRNSAVSSNTYQNNADRALAFQTGDCVAGQPCDVGTKGFFNRNDFGFSVGGPVKKNKLFFFNNTEWIRVRSSSPIQYTIIDPSSVSTLSADAQAFYGSFGKLDTNVRTLRKLPCNSAGSPGSNLTCDLVSFAVPADAGGGLPENTWMEVFRMDFNVTDKTTIYGRYAGYNELDFAGTINSSPYAGYNTGQTNFDQNIDFNINHVFAPNVVNTAKIIYNRLNGPVQPLGTAPVGPTLYISGNLNEIPGTSVPLVFPGYNETTPGNSIPFGGPQNLYQFYDDLSYTRGKHQFKFGGQFIHIRDNRTFGAYLNAVEFLGNKTLDSGLGNLLSGNIYQFQGAVFPQGKFPCVKDVNTGKPMVTPDCTLQLPVGPPAFNRNYHYNDGAAYAQDSWKVTPRLTVNLGLRWEYFGVQHNANPNLDSNFVFGPGANVFEQVRNGQVKLAKDGGVFWKPEYHDFAPRVGFAYDLFGNGKTSLRGGYAMSYERNFGNVTFNAIQNPPNYAVISLVSGTDVASMPIFTDNAGPLAGTGTKALPAVSQRAINQHMSTAYAETWDLAIEHQVAKNTVFSVAYAGSHGVHLYDIANLNNGGTGGAYLGDVRAANRLNLQYSNMNFRSDNGFSHYNALNVGLRGNNLGNKGLGFTANYTWSHSLDNLSSTFSEAAGGLQSGLYALGYLDEFNPRLDYGNSDFDIRHRASVSVAWELPWMKSGGNAIARTILGGWGLGTVFTVRSGYPFSIYDCTNSTDAACPQWVPPSAVPKTGTPVQVPGQANTFNYITLPADNTGATLNVGDSLGIPTCTGLFHTGCTYTVSGLPYPRRNNYYGPMWWNTDANFYKNFKLTERFTMQFRAEMYNIFNHFNQYVAYLNLDASATNAIQTEKGGPLGYAGQPQDERRNVQFGLRLTF